MTRSPDLAGAIVAALDDLALDELADRLAHKLAARLAASEPPSDEWLPSSKAAAYLGISTNAPHKLTAARSIPFEQDGPGCKMWFKRSKLDEWRRAGNVGSSDRIASRGRLTPLGSRTPTPR
jgi:excisionase family DNA binding protein